MDQGEVADSEQGGEDGKVMDAQLDEDYFCKEGPWEGQVVEEIEMVELNNDVQCNGSYRCCGYKANVPKPFAFSYPFQLHAFMKLAFTFSENALFFDICSGTVNASGETRAACQMLPHTKAVQQIESRA